MFCILAKVTASFAIVIAPVLLIVASHDIGVCVATLLAFHISILPDDNVVDSFQSRAVCVAVLIGLFMSLVLSTLLNHTAVLSSVWKVLSHL
jgi:hypothetical protein